MNRDFWRNKKVLITGHTGFKGSWLSLWLANSGAEVFGYSLRPNTNPALYNLLELEQQITSVYGDVRQYDDLRNFILDINPEIIIHMAAQSLVNYSYAHPIETYSTNVMGTVHLLEAARFSKSVQVVINVTTDKCYENREWEWGYRENETMGGHDPYSSSKGCSELVTSAYRNSYFNPKEFRRHGKAIASARAGNVIGGGDWAQNRLVPDIINAFIKREKVKIRNPQAIRPWQHVLEPLSGYLLLAEKLWYAPTKYAESWNFGPESIDIQNVEYIVRILAKKWGDKCVWELDDANHTHEANHLMLDISKAKYQLAWRPTWGLEKTLDALVEWYKTWAAGGDIKNLCISQIRDYERATPRIIANLNLNK